jgi:Salmonella virulence plasmid 65kDa B protein/Carboxylesterase family
VDVRQPALLREGIISTGQPVERGAHERAGERAPGCCCSAVAGQPAGPAFGLRTASLTVPVATSPGRSGFGPSLALSYDSGAGNGPFGLGWRLSPPAVTRKTDKGLPRYADDPDTDAFLLPGSDDLVPVRTERHGRWEQAPERRRLAGREYAVQRYRPRVDGLFSRIERWRDLGSGDTHWRTITSGNVTTLYGTTASSRVADPADPARAASAIGGQVETLSAPARWGRLAFALVVDGDSLPDHPLDALNRGAASGVRLLAGWNRDDVRIGLVPTVMIDIVDKPALTAVASALGAPDGTVGLYRAARPGASSGDLLAAVATDCFMRVPAIRVAEARLAAGEADTRMYCFDHESPSFVGRLGAAHAVELPYVFDLLDDESSHALIGDAPPQAVADTAHGAWVCFVADGDPGWPRYNLAEQATALIDEGITGAGDPDGAERDLWAGRR